MNSPRTVQRTSSGRECDSPRTVPTQTETETKNNPYPSRIMALRAIHSLDGLAVALAMLRPDWDVAAIRAVLGRSNGSTRDIARRALTLALDPDVRTPNGIENADMRRYDTTPVLPTVAEALALELCPRHTPAGFRADACPMCRRTT